MSYIGLLETARAEFSELPAQRNVVVLHPQYRYHTALINTLVEASQRKVVYITLPRRNTALAAWWEALQLELAAQYQYELVSLPDNDVNSAVKALAAPIKVLKPLAIVVNAFDMAGTGLVEFVARAAERYVGELLFIIDSRGWPQELVQQVSSQHVAVLPVAAHDMLLDYTAHDANRVLLEVRALGSGQVFINGRQIDQWDGALPRALFFYFIDRGMTTRDEVFSTFWPELSTREATNVFHVTKRKISEILNVDLTVYSSGFYRIAPNIDLYYDVVSFVEAVQNAAVADSPAEAETLLTRAIRLHEREYLGDFDQPWALRRREELRMTYVDALTVLARLYEDSGRLAEALGLYNRAFGAYPQREDLARIQMRLYDEAGQRDRALAVYERLEHELQHKLKVPPSPETVALAEELRRTIQTN